MRSRPYSSTVVLAAAMLAGGGASTAQAAHEPSLERGLLRQASALIKHFEASGCKNVGVLKFLVEREGGTLSDNAGTLNMQLARRLEVALVLANDAKNPVGVIRNASAVAARTPGANHQSAAGRKKLFGPNYPLAWGKTRVKADAFVTGVAQISKNLRELKVGLRVFDRSASSPAPFGEDFTVRNEPGKLAEMNESFVLRGLGSGNAAVEAAAQIKEQHLSHPLTGDVPVKLVVLYDDKPVRIDYRNGKAFIKEPQEGQKVAFHLRRDGGKMRYGVVLKVNGENTIARQRLPDLHCRRWVLAPGWTGPVTIRGYQKDNGTAGAFRVLSRAASKEREIDYGDDVGTVTMTVFAEGKETPRDAGEKRESRDARVASRAGLPEQMDTFVKLKAALLAEGVREEFRGLLGEGDRVASKVRSTVFHPAPTPLMSVTLIYYRP